MSRKLTLNELKYVQKEVKLKGKRTSLSYILAVLFGFLGVHLGYLEKSKSAIMRFLLTTSTAILFFLVFSTVEMLNVGELTMRLQQYSSALTVGLGLTSAAQVIWLMYDLVMIPSWVRESNEKLERKSAISVIQAGYAAEDIRKDESSQAVIKKVIESIELEIKDKVDNKIADANHRLDSSIKDLLLKERQISELSREMNAEIESVERLSSRLNENVNELQRYMIREIGNLKTEVKDIFTSAVEIAEASKKYQSELDEAINEEEGGFIIEDIDDNEEGEVFIVDSEIEDIIDNEVDRIVDELSFLTEVVSEDTDDPEVDTVKSFNEAIESNGNSEVNVEESDRKSHITPGIISVKDALNTDGIIRVEGYIVGSMDSGGKMTTSKFKIDSNVVISDSTQDVENILVIQISKRSNLRDEFGLNSSPENLGRKIIVSGRKSKYFNIDGVKKPDELKFSN